MTPPSPPSSWNEVALVWVALFVPMVELQATTPLGRYLSALVGIVAIMGTTYMIGHIRGASRPDEDEEPML